METTQKVVPMKRVSVFSIDADAATGKVTVRAGGETVTICTVDLPNEIRDLAIVHGIKQKIGDAGAVTAGDNGKVDPEEKIRRVLAMAERIKRGVWNERAIGGTSDDSVLIRALAMAYPQKTRDQIATYVDGLKGPEKRALLAPKSPIAEHVEKVRGDMAGDVDTEALLAGL